MTALARGVGARVRATLAGWVPGNGGHSLPPSHARGELEVRRLEELYSLATDVHDLERMERDFNRRDGGGIRNWD